jgi:mannose-6-phosphate isomerase-like protein (cupin superfamily)
LEAVTGRLRGRLLDASAAPERGERVRELARVGNAVVEQILSGELERPVDYCQEQDELVVVLAGAAVLDVAGERVDLGAGEWMLLPAGTPHRLLHTEPGTNWLAVHVHGAQAVPAAP